jgi:hypothetical protein
MNTFYSHRQPILPAARRAAARDQLEQVVAQSAARRPRKRLTLVAAGITALVLTTGAAAFVVAGHQQVTNKAMARCYTTADASGSNFTTVTELVPGSGTGEVTDAVSTCAALFRQGFLRVGGAGINRFADGKPDHRVPMLVECVMSDGTAAVFPGGPGTCHSLGLPRASR